MRAVVFPQAGTVEVVDVPEPVIQAPGDVILEVTAAAICGSDLRSLQITAGDPVWPVGHEFAGVVRAIGSDVHTVRSGDRCGAPMYTVCGACRHCTSGRQNDCDTIAVFGSSHRYGRHPGGQAQFVRIPQADRTLTVLPDGVHDDDATLLSDILPTAFTVLDRLGPLHGEDLLVVGCGPVGQLTTMAAPLFGVGRVIAVDLDQERLDRAVALGAHGVLAGEHQLEAVLELTGGRGVAAAVDATGNPVALGACFDALQPRGGRVFTVNGNAGVPFPFTPQQLFAKRASVVASIGNPYRWRAAMIDLIACGRLTPRRIVSDHVPLADAKAAYASFGAHGANKVVLDPRPSA